MSLMDAFSKEDRTEIKFSDLYRLIADSVKAEYLQNMVSAEVPYRYIREMTSGENDELAAYRAIGMSPLEIREVLKAYDDLRVKMEDYAKQIDGGGEA